MELITSRTKTPEQVNDVLCSRTLNEKGVSLRKVLYEVCTRDIFITSTTATTLLTAMRYIKHSHYLELPVAI